MTRKQLSANALSCLLVVLILLSSMSVNAQSDQFGQWETLTTLPFSPVHNYLLPTGNVMIWRHSPGISGDDLRLWTPADQSVTTLATPG
jgi:hypothetical protein